MNLSSRYDNGNDLAVLSPPLVNGKSKNSTFTVEVITNTQKFDALETEWDQLAKQSNVHIFQLYFWLRTWWQHFGQKAKLHIILIRQNETLIGIAPLYIENYSFLFPGNFKYLRLIGSTIPHKGIRTSFYKYGISDYLDFIVHPDKEEVVTDILIDHLQGPDCQYDKAFFQDAPSDSFIMRSLTPALEQRKWNIVKEVGDKCPCTELPETNEDYLMSLDRKTRYKLRHSDRAVNKKHLFYISNQSSVEQVPSTLRNLINLHQKRWIKRGELGAFADSRYGPFVLDVCKKAAKSDKLWMYSAYDGSQCIAVDCSFAFNGRIYNYLKSFDDSHPLAKYRPGLAIHYEIIKKAIRSGELVVDLLRGVERYKLKLTNRINSNWNVSFDSPSGINPIKGSSHRMDYFLFRNNQTIKRFLYLFKNGWEKQKKNHIRYAIDFIKFMINKLIVRLSSRIDKELHNGNTGQ